MPHISIASTDFFSYGGREGKMGHLFPCLILAALPWMNLERRLPLRLDEENQAYVEASEEVSRDHLRRVQERKIPWVESVAFILAVLGLHQLLNRSPFPLRGLIGKKRTPPLEVLKEVSEQTSLTKQEASKISFAVRALFGAQNETVEELKHTISPEVIDLLSSLDQVKFSREGISTPQEDKVKQTIQSIASSIVFASIEGEV